MIRFFALAALLALSGLTIAQSGDEVRVIKNLKSDWKVFSNNEYQNFDPSNESDIVYFLVDANLYKGAALQIESKREFSIFINGNLIVSRRKGLLFIDLDSLSSLYSKQLEFSIIRPSVDLSTQLVIRKAMDIERETLVKRTEQHFFNFSILASLILIVFLVALLRTNPKLAFDYLNFIKLFSLQEREENIMAIRITSSANLLFYTFVSLFAAFLLIVIFHFAYLEISLAGVFWVDSVKGGFFQWLILSAIILLMLFGKLILIGIFSYLYKATEITPLQFFNFIRLFFFTFGVISFLAVLFFVGKVQNPTWYYNLFYVATTIFIFWEIVIFLKLMSRVPFRIFHLFFYLCATELIPFVILIKVVFY